MAATPRPTAATPTRRTTPRCGRATCPPAAGHDKWSDKGCGCQNGSGKGGEQNNSSTVSQGDDEANGGDGNATGGDGGDADTGNKQFLNGNSAAVSFGGRGVPSIVPIGSGGGKAESKGGDTFAKSGDAYGGHGGDAKAYGGDADASDNAKVWQGNLSSGGDEGHRPHKGYDKWSDNGCGCQNGSGRGDEQNNSSTVSQGDDEANGGDGNATGGDGGDADTGNKQFLNGNSAAVSFGGGSSNGSIPFAAGGKGGPHGSQGTESEGGDTFAKSGDAYGGHGGDAKAYGGDADASDNAYVWQGNREGGGSKH